MSKPKTLTAAVAICALLSSHAIADDVVLIGASSNTVLAHDARMLWQSWKCHFYASATQLFVLDPKEMFRESFDLSRHVVPLLRESATTSELPITLMFPDGPSDDFVIGGIQAKAHMEASREIFGDKLLYTLNLLSRTADIEMMKAKWVEESCESVHVFIKGRNAAYTAE